MRRIAGVLCFAMVMFFVTLTEGRNERTDRVRYEGQWQETRGVEEAPRGGWSKLEREVHDKINRVRARYGLPPLQLDERVCAIARSHSASMADRCFFAHTDPVHGGLAQRVARHRLTYSRCAENIYKSNAPTGLGDSAVAGWMNSPGHRENILKPGFCKTGIGVARGRDGFVYITQVFSTP